MKVYFKRIALFYLIVFFPLCLNGQFSNLSTGTDYRVEALYVDSISDILYIGGQFEIAGGANINNIASWDGTTFSTFGNNQLFSSPGSVQCITKFNGNIIVGGGFDSIGVTTVNNIAMWDGQDWIPMGDGFNSLVACLIVYNNELYAGGQFNISGNQIIRGLAKWNGVNWIEVTPLIGSVQSFELYRGKLIVGGSFHHSSLPAVNNIMAWDGSNIDTSYNGFNDNVTSLLSINDTLCAVGHFTSSIFPCNYIAIYNGTSWDCIGNPTGGSNWVTNVAKYKGTFFFSGLFTNPPDLCKFNGIDFDSVGNFHGFIQSMEIFRGDLIISGHFDLINNLPFNNIVKYDNTNISVNEIRNQNERSLYIDPNPFNDYFKINLNGSIIKVDIYDVMQHKINDFYFVDDVVYLNSNLAAGVYYVCVVNGEGEWFKVKAIKF